MGLAASQARFLNLTARKSNLEYEGQQINQQRTVLANASANYYSQMLTLQVPTPPSTEAFKKVSYQFTDGAKGTASITQITSTGTAGKYSIVYTDTWTEADQMSKLLVADNVSKSASGAYLVGSKQLVKIDASSSDAEAKKLAEIKTRIEEELKAASGKSSIGDIYFLKTSNSYRFFIGSDLTALTAGGDSKEIYGYRQTDVEKNETNIIKDVTIVRDASNRVVSFAQDGKDAVSVINVEVTDEEAYNDAYNQYTYETYLYSQAMENINAQTSIIQAKDKQLELRLKQLDTEHNAINTEIDSLSSVIKDNSEKSFKTFA